MGTMQDAKTFQNPHKARESWLRAVLDGFIRDWFREHGHTIPRNVLVSLGWPPNRRVGRSGTMNVGGVCCPTEWNGGKAFIIYLTPQAATAEQYLSVLCHELVHATVGLGEKHGKVFKDCGKDVGLEGKPTEMQAGEELRKAMMAWVRRSKLGKFPHHQERAKMRHQGTRMLKVRCTNRDCESRNMTGTGTGYTIRVTRTWLDAFGAPFCPCCESEMVEA